MMATDDRAPDEPITVADLISVRKAIRKLDQRIDEVFDEIHNGDDAQADLWNEHEEKIKRLTRQIRRLKEQIEGEP